MLSGGVGGGRHHPPTLPLAGPARAAGRTTAAAGAGSRKVAGLLAGELSLTRRCRRHGRCRARLVLGFDRPLESWRVLNVVRQRYR